MQRPFSRSVRSAGNRRGARGRPRALTGVAAHACFIAACASGGVQSGTGSAAPEPPDPGIAAAVAEATLLEQPLQITFAWTLQERDARFTGRGVTRTAPPLRARLDLFGPRGEGYLSAALIGQELRLPAGSGDAPLPPPALFWSVLGVFQPPEGATLVSTQRNGTGTQLRYELGEQRWSFRFDDDVLRSAEWVGPGQGRRTVELSGDGGHGLPGQAVYRDWPAFRELRVTLQEVTEVNGFPSDTWIVGSR